MTLVDILKFIFKDPAERKISKIMPIVDRINQLEPEISAMTDDELKAQTTKFKEFLASRETSSDPKTHRK